MEKTEAPKMIEDAHNKPLQETHVIAERGHVATDEFVSTKEMLSILTILR